MSRTGRADAFVNNSGFTLLEVVCVMAIIAMLAAFALPGLTPGTSRLGLERIAMRVAALMQADRYAAIRRHETISTAVDTRAREIRSGANPAVIPLPPDVNLNVRFSNTCPTNGAVAVLWFDANGGSCGGGLTLERGGVGFQVLANWLTGGVEIVPLNAR